MTTEWLLSHFSHKKNEAVLRYETFVADGYAEGRRRQNFVSLANTVWVKIMLVKTTLVQRVVKILSFLVDQRREDNS